MALEALKADVVGRLRACAAADGAYFTACMHLLRDEQERWLNFMETAHMHMATELEETPRGRSPQSSPLTLSEMFTRMSNIFKGLEGASQTLLDVRTHHCLVFRQYLELELAIIQVSLDPPPVSPSTQDADNTPETADEAAAAAAAAAAAVDAAAVEAVDRLIRLQSCVRDKEVDQHLHDRLRWQRLLEPQNPPMLPRLLFISQEQQELLQQQADKLYEDQLEQQLLQHQPQQQKLEQHLQKQLQQQLQQLRQQLKEQQQLQQQHHHQQEQEYVQAFQHLPFQNGSRVTTVESVMV
ncbi:hypothetical protein ACSSS7_007045 [Eimeria intestinalis]